MSVMFTDVNDIKLMKDIIDLLEQHRANAYGTAEVFCEAIDRLEKSNAKQTNEPRYHTLRNAMNSQVQIAYNNASFMTTLLLTARGFLASDDNKENVAPECRVYCADCPDPCCVELGTEDPNAE